MLCWYRQKVTLCIEAHLVMIIIMLVTIVTMTANDFHLEEDILQSQVVFLYARYGICLDLSSLTWSLPDCSRPHSNVFDNMYANVAFFGMLYLAICLQIFQNRNENWGGANVICQCLCTNVINYHTFHTCNLEEHISNSQNVWMLDSMTGYHDCYGDHLHGDLNIVCEIWGQTI